LYIKLITLFCLVIRIVMYRSLDLFLSLVGLILFSPIMIVILIIGFLKNGSPLFRQLRVGYKQNNFTLLKFRSMSIDTKSIATHLIDFSNISLYGQFLRKTKIDELPQLINVLNGDMSLVGPRPCLPNQTKLISERKKRGVFNVKPGMTGLAQITGVTMKNPKILAKKDAEMIKKLNILNYFYYLFKTFFLIIKKK